MTERIPTQILQILDYSLHHEEKLPELYRLARIVNYSSEAQNDLKRDQITLLAPSSKALQPRSGGEAKKHPFYTAEQEVDERDDSRRARFAKIVAYVLRYHTISSVETVEDLTDRSTIPSSLVDHDEALRIRVEPSFSLFPPRSTLKFNYAQTEGLTIFAKNGVSSRLSFRFILSLIVQYCPLHSDYPCDQRSASPSFHPVKRSIPPSYLFLVSHFIPSKGRFRSSDFTITREIGTRGGRVEEYCRGVN